jgi:hypothetical protein
MASGGTVRGGSRPQLESCGKQKRHKLTDGRVLFHLFELRERYEVVLDFRNGADNLDLGKQDRDEKRRVSERRRREVASRRRTGSISDDLSSVIS